MIDDEVSRPRVRFLLGGARSGKSRLAVRLARGDEHVLFLATARPADAEMEARVERHKEGRPESWTTVEAPVHLPEAIREAVAPHHTVILDCLTLWVANLLAEANLAGSGDRTGDMREEGEEEILRRTDDLLSAIAAHGFRWIVVSNEVGTGLHPDTPLGRRYRDLLGLVNQRVASAADRASLIVAGQVLELRSPGGGDASNPSG